MVVYQTALEIPCQPPVALYHSSSQIAHRSDYHPDQGVFGNILVKQDFLDTVGNPSVTAQGTMTSVYNLGCFAGALSTIYTGR